MDKVKIEYPEQVFLGIVLLLVCFCGEPDLIDAIIHFLMK